MSTALPNTSAATIDLEEQVLIPTPTSSEGRPRQIGGFASLTEALDFAAEGETGLNFYNTKSVLEHVIPYRDLRRNAIDMAHQLIGLGLNRGDRIGLVADMSPDFVTIFFACQYAGLMTVPLPALTGLGGRKGYEEQLRQVLMTSKARIAVGPDSAIQSLEEASQGLDLLLVGTPDDIRRHALCRAILTPLKPNEPSHIQFSSGSTRNPLGIVISQKSLMENANSVGRFGLQFKEDDRCASWLPFYHDMGLIGFLLIPLTSQISIDYIYTDGFARRPLAWLDVISKNRCTMTYSPTFGYELCTRRAEKQRDLDIDLSCLRIAGIGGEMVQAEVLSNFTERFESNGYEGKAFVPSYGLAEATLAVSFSPINEGPKTDKINRQKLIDEHLAVPATDDEESRTFSLCGKLLPGYHVEIRNDHGDILHDREIGKVYVRAPSLMTEYDDNEAATRKAMDKAGWLNTGDMGYMIDGHLVITGRFKDLIIINGRNIWPQDLEWHVEDELDILQPRSTAAFAVESEDGTDEAVILVQCRSSDAETQENLHKDVQSSIYKNAGIQCHVVLIPSGKLPFTTSGKLSRSKAKKLYLEGVLSDIRS
jgi:fatty-acyl-CoA synthase